MTITEFIQSRGRSILSVLVRLTNRRDIADAEDLHQNVLAKCWIYSEKNGHLPPFLWVKRVAQREYSSWRRKRTPALLPVGFDLARDPAATMDEEERSLVMLAVFALPPQYREIVRLHYLEGRSLSQIEKEQGISVSTARMRLYRARLRLAKKLKGLRSN